MMLASKVACPSCRSPLRSDRPVPVGARVKCPCCGVPFAVPADTSAPAYAAATDGIRPGVAPLVAAEAAAAASAVPVAQPAIAAPYAVPAPPAGGFTARPRGNWGLIIAAVAFGLILLLGG